MLGHELQKHPVPSLLGVVNLVDDDIVLLLAVGRDVERREPGLAAVLGADEAVAEGQLGGACVVGRVVLFGIVKNFGWNFVGGFFCCYAKRSWIFILISATKI